MKKNLVLLGMPGSGKSSLGQLLAKITGLKLYDVDKLIVEETGLEIAQIFQTKGEEFFRKIEEKKTLEILKKTNNIIFSFSPLQISFNFLFSSIFKSLFINLKNIIKKPINPTKEIKGGVVERNITNK